MNTRREFLAQTGMSAFALAAARAWAADADPALLKRALKLLEQAPFIDTHNDLPSMILELAAGDVSQFDLTKPQPKLCADVPAMRGARVGAQYWSVYVGSDAQARHDALHLGMREFDAALQIIKSTPAFEQARTAADIDRITRSGRIACLLGVEGGHQIEESPAVLRVFHELGARYLTLTHFGNVPWADAATDLPVNFGLTEFGRKLVREMNRLGMFADISHVSADTMRDVLQVTRAPVIFSHSSAYALNPHPRNVPDEILKLLPANGGVCHVNFIRVFVSPEGQAWTDKRAAALREIHARLADQAQIDKAIADWEKSTGQPKATLSDAADHIDHIRKVAGIDHIGIGADYWSINPDDMADGMATLSCYPYLFAELVRRGYTDDDILKIAGRNHLRALRAMEKVAAELQKTEKPLNSEPSVAA